MRSGAVERQRAKRREGLSGAPAEAAEALFGLLHESGMTVRDRFRNHHTHDRTIALVEKDLDAFARVSLRCAERPGPARMPAYPLDVLAGAQAVRTIVATLAGVDPLP